MKTILKACNAALVCIALLLTTNAFAKEDGNEKTKSYTKTYDISGTDKIDIENSFGKTKLITWGENKIQVDVDIKTSANTDELAQKLMDAINIEDGKSSSGVYFRTHIENNNGNNKGKHTEMEINYTVHLPAGNPLDLKTSFGDTFIPDYNGPASIEEKFGNLNTGNLYNVKDLNVQFGSAKIESIANCKFTVGYSTFAVKKFSGDIDAKFDFCDGGELNLDNSIKSLKIYNNYSSIKINASKDLSADFDIETHFGDFINHTDYAIDEEKEKDGEWKSPKFDYHYTGKAGGGNIKVKIKSNFGSTTMR
jgi:hypothetical protein